MIAVRKNAQPMNREEIDPALDYTNNMFKDGNNRAENDKKVQRAPAYDRAAHQEDEGVNDFTLAADAIPASTRTAESRDGTQASGIYDEEGGPLGGTEAELDALEASGTPVDRNPRMKE